MIQFDLLCVSDITGGQKQNKESCVQPHYDYDFLALAVTPHKRHSTSESEPSSDFHGSSDVFCIYLIKLTIASQTVTKPH